jgi:uncharacterized membrane protein YuzA (DUF378 family)
VLSRVIYVVICLAAIWSITLFFREDTAGQTARGTT